jgi:hypothetical protein
VKSENDLRYEANRMAVAANIGVMPIGGDEFGFDRDLDIGGIHSGAAFRRRH